VLSYLETSGVGPAPHIKLDLQPRLNLFTGDNGLGKTFVLDVAWFLLTGDWAGRAAWPGSGSTEPFVQGEVSRADVPASPGAQVSGRYSFSSQCWEQSPSGERRDQGPTIYVRADGGLSIWDLARQSSPTTTMSAYHFTEETLWNGLEEGTRILCNGLIRDWVAWQRSDRQSFELLCTVLKHLSPAGEAPLTPGQPVRMAVDDVRDIPTLDMPYGTVPVVLASAGARRILGLAYVLVWAHLEHAVAAKLRHWAPSSELHFIIDEIEIHLHPRWQRCLLPALLSLTDATKAVMPFTKTVQILTTTHSPLVLASLEPLFQDNSDALFLFEENAGSVTVERSDWRPRGDATAWLTSDLFGLGQARSVEAEEALTEAMRVMRNPDASQDELARVETLLIPVLPDTDPFWARWTIVRDRHR